MNHYNNTPQNSLIWMKSKIPSSPWDEEHLGGLVWPPRFYSCSFCRREFRSAQALGGHMNVHRRDRAKLRQSCISDQEILSFSDSKTTTEENTRKLSDHDGEVVVCKRLKKSGVSPLVPFLYCSSSSSREEIDLELRLGDPPAVK